MSGHDEKRWKKPKMVGWYDPSQLVRTGVKTLLSTLLGSMIDARRFAAVEGKDADCVFDYSRKTFPEKKETRRGFRCEARYPESRTSRKLSFGNLLFAFKNWKMSAFLGAVYVLLFWRAPGRANLPTYPIDQPASFLLILMVLAGFYAFADLQGIAKMAWGLGHGAGHILRAIASWRWGFAMVPHSWLSNRFLEIYLPRLCVFLAGALSGGTLLGCYLIISMNLMRIHENEGFSALQIAGLKHFLRCRLTADGLKVYVIAVERTASDQERHPVATRLVEAVDIR